MKRLASTLTALGLFLLAAGAHAYTAVAFSNSTHKFGGAKNATSEEEARAEALANCRKNGGGDDCRVFKVSDSLGFSSLHMACAGGGCGVTATTGRASQAEAHAQAKRDCEKQYGVSCRPVAEWEEKVGDAQQTPQPRSTSFAESNPKPQPPAYKYLQSNPRRTQQRNDAALPEHDIYYEQARQGDAEAQYRYGMGQSELAKEHPLTYSGSAEHWLGKAAEQGHQDALLQLCRLIGRKTKSEAMECFHKAANRGIPEAQYAVAENYYLEILPDRKKAFSWYMKAAMQGHPDAQYRVGQYYRFGSWGVPEDRIKAIDWFSKSAAQGNREARRELGNMQLQLGQAYILGTGVKENHRTALSLFRDAATNGNALAKEYVETWPQAVAAIRNPPRVSSEAAASAPDFSPTPAYGARQDYNQTYYNNRNGVYESRTVSCENTPAGPVFCR